MAAVGALGAVSVVLAVILALVAGIVVASYIGLTRRSEAVDDAWSQIDAHCARRYELVPALVDCAMTGTSRDPVVFGELIRARTAAQSASGPPRRARAEDALTAALRSAFAILEAYPQLQANRRYLDVQRELADTENRMAFARRRYNDAVVAYSGAAHVFPGNLVASVFGMDMREPFTAAAAAGTERPSVEMSRKGAGLR